MANGITYFRLVSEYDGDITKDCGLTGNEVDNNFYTLEGRDIKSVTVEDNAIKITLLNGDVISSGDIFGDYGKVDVSYDTENGVLHITQNGVTTDIEGFLSEAVITNNYYVEAKSSHDYTLTGNGTKASPLSVAPQYRTGYYKAVNSIVRLNEGDELPSSDTLQKGDRFLVVENCSKYGLLYNYDGVRCIATDLNNNCSEWRIPTKEDWDDMLNAIELSDEHKNHDTAGGNKYLGQFAGKFLKSSDGWKPYESGNEEDTLVESNTCMCGRHIQCNSRCCGEYGTCMTRIDNVSPVGTDKYGFNALPAGYADDGKLYGYFGERAAFWTATNSVNLSSAYIKRLEYDKKNVYQDITPNSYYLSLRLVKDYDGTNSYGREEILGEYYDTVLMPSVNGGSKVWTAVNVCFNDERYHALAPNNGEGVDAEPIYHILEWDGEKWLSNLFDEGDMVTVLNDEDGKYSTEYKLVNNQLVNLRDYIATDVIDVVQPIIDAEIERATDAENEINSRIDELDAKVNQEIEDRTNSESNLTVQIDQLNHTVEEHSQTLINVQNSVENIEHRLSDEIRSREVAEEQLQQALDEEVQSRQDADEELAQHDAEIEGKLYKSQTGQFDPETGVLNIESNDGTNDLSVQFTFNFGTV